MSKLYTRRVFFAWVAVFSLSSQALAGNFYCDSVYQRKYEKIARDRGWRVVGKAAIGVAAGVAAGGAIYYLGKGMRLTGNRAQSAKLEGLGNAVQYAGAPIVGLGVGYEISQIAFDRTEGLQEGYAFLNELNQPLNPEPNADAFTKMVVILDWKAGKSPAWNNFLYFNEALELPVRMEALRGFLAGFLNDNTFCKAEKALTLRQLSDFIRDEL